MKIGLVIGLFIAFFVALVAYSTFHGPRYRVEVCVEFEGRKTCKTVEAKSKEAAIRSGTEGACADIASGVTETMRCVGSEPATVTWLDKR